MNAGSGPAEAGPPGPALALDGALAAVTVAEPPWRGLPNALYTSDEAFARERERLFFAGWACVGVASRLARVGAAIPVTLMGAPLLVVRTADGIAVFHNVCSHRGAVLVTRPRRSEGTFRCPYHGWTYGLDGALVATPDAGGPGIDQAPGLDRGCLGLKRVRSAVWADMIFVNLDGCAPALEEHLAPLTARWAAYDFSLLRHGGKKGGSTRLTLAANWKLAVENYCESYHLPVVHPGLNSYSRLEDHYHIMIGGDFAGQGTTAYRPPTAARFPEFPGLDEETRRGAEYVALYPNVLLGVQADHFYAVILEPQAHDRTVEHVEIYYVGEGASDPALAEARAETVARWRQVFVEDVLVVERMQAGRHSPGFAGGWFSPVMDAPSHHFHRWVAGRLAA